MNYSIQIHTLIYGSRVSTSVLEDMQSDQPSVGSEMVRMDVEPRPEASSHPPSQTRMPSLQFGTGPAAMDSLSGTPQLQPQPNGSFGFGSQLPSSAAQPSSLPSGAAVFSSPQQQQPQQQTSGSPLGSVASTLPRSQPTQPQTSISSQLPGQLGPPPGGAMPQQSGAVHALSAQQPYSLPDLSPPTDLKPWHQVVERSFRHRVVHNRYLAKAQYSGVGPGIMQEAIGEEKFLFEFADSLDEYLVYAAPPSMPTPQPPTSVHPSDQTSRLEANSRKENRFSAKGLQVPHHTLQPLPQYPSAHSPQTAGYPQVLPRPMAAHAQHMSCPMQHSGHAQYGHPQQYRVGPMQPTQHAVTHRTQMYQSPVNPQQSQLQQMLRQPAQQHYQMAMDPGMQAAPSFMYSWQ